MQNFPKAFSHVINVEGGYVNDPNDPGGETKYGISKRSYPNEDIKNLTMDRAREIYKADYWDSCHCDELPHPLDIYLFDAAVNHGVVGAVKMLQRSLGIVITGKVDPLTLKLAKLSGNDVSKIFLSRRAVSYAKSSNFDRYGFGWMKRLFILNEFAHTGLL